MSQPKVYVCYAYPNTDAVFGALAVRMFYASAGRDDDVTFKACRQNLTVEEQLELASTINNMGEIVLVDFMGSEEFVRHLCAFNKRVLLFHHDKVSKDAVARMRGENQGRDFPGNFYPDVNTAPTGGLQAFNDYVTAGASGVDAYSNLLWTLSLIADRIHLTANNSAPNDAWHAGFAAKKIELDCGKNPAVFDQLAALDKEELIAEGIEILKGRQEAMKTVLDAKFPLVIHGDHEVYETLGVECDDWTLINDLGIALAKINREQGKPPLGVVVSKAAGNGGDFQYKLSMRSLGDFDVAAIAKFNRGGSGPNINAAAFTASLIDLNVWKGLATTGMSS